MRPKFHAPGKIRHSKWMRRACEVASKTVEPPCQDVSAKGMSLGNGFARRAAGLGQFIRSAAGTAANPRRFHAHGKIRHIEGHCHAIEVAFETVESLRQDVSAKGMPFGKWLRPAYRWIGPIYSKRRRNMDIPRRFYASVRRPKPFFLTEQGKPRFCAPRGDNGRPPTLCPPMGFVRWESALRIC